MKFIFWQNIISIHQSAFIKALSKEHDVTLVAEEQLDKQRVSESWNIPEMGRAKVIVAPSNSEIRSLLAEDYAWHVFSGIDAFPMVYKAFKQAVKLDRRIAVMAEPYDWTGFKGKLRIFKYKRLFNKYRKHINHLFTTGNHGINCFKVAGMPEDKIHQWGYFTEFDSDAAELNLSENKRPKIIFVGKIDKRKNVIQLVLILNELHDYYGEVNIIGTGPLEYELKEHIADNDKIHYLGSKPNDEVKKYIGQSDLLVLPSLFDGWGAVVNEALSQGTRVLCSDMCGAGILLDEDSRGGEFTLHPSNMKTKLVKWLVKGAISKTERKEIKEWANNHISGEVAANYFVETLDGRQPNVPWM